MYKNLATSLAHSDCIPVMLITQIYNKKISKIFFERIYLSDAKQVLRV